MQPPMVPKKNRRTARLSQVSQRMVEQAEKSLRESLHAEEWRPVVGFEGKYEVSNLGRVRGLRRGVVLSGRNGDRHPMVVLVDHSGEYVNRLIHRMVLEAFVGRCPRGMSCSHKNGNKFDARLCNLEWATMLKNMRMKAVHGTKLLGERTPSAKLTADKVRCARILHRNGWEKERIARMFNVGRPTIHRAIIGKWWSHVT